MQSLLMSSSLNTPNDANPTSTTTIAHDVNLPTTTTTNITQSITTARKTPQPSGPTDFKDDPFKDYRYEDPFTLKDPFADDDDIDVFSDPNKVFKDDLSSDDDDVKSKLKSTTPTLPVRQTPIGSDFLNKFDAFTLNASSVSDTKSKSNTPVADFDNFANFDAFGTTVASNTNALNNNTHNNGGNNKSDNFFEVFNDNFELNDKNNGNLNKNSNNFNNNLFDAFGKTTPTTALDINQSYNSKNNNSKQAFGAFDAFSATTTTTTTKSDKLFEDDFNDNSFGDTFFNLDSSKKMNNNNNLTTKINTNVNFDEFDGGSSSFVADFNMALNNSKNFNGSHTSTSTSTKAMPSTTKAATLTKVQNKTTLTKQENSNAGKLPEKFVNDFSQPDTFDADLEEALRRSMIDQ